MLNNIVRTVMLVALVASISWVGWEFHQANKSLHQLSQVAWPASREAIRSEAIRFPGEETRKLREFRVNVSIPGEVDVRPAP